MERIKMVASDGMILTNGDIYGREVFLGTGDNPDNWHEITVQEYSRLQEEQAANEQAQYGG